MQSHSRVAVKTPAEQAAMRVAGRLAADVLDMIGPRIGPGMTTGEIDRICHDFIVNTRHAIPAPLNYKGFRSRSAPRSTTWSATASRATSSCTGRPHQYRCDRHQGWLSRRYEPHVFLVGIPRVLPRGVVASHARGNVPRHRRRAPRRPPRRHRARDPELRRERALLGRTRILRPRHRRGSSTRTRRSCITACPGRASTS